MSACCGHREEDHHLTEVCQEVTHYPNEDYPCLCAGYEDGRQSGVCLRCEHRRDLHARARVCRPASDAYCACSRVIDRE
jgi:hypothetical protein